jgi:hypothetical protein
VPALTVAVEAPPEPELDECLELLPPQALSSAAETSHRTIKRSAAIKRRPRTQVVHGADESRRR